MDPDPVPVVNGPSENGSNSPEDAPRSAARPYRSKKQRPCDSCRRRRVGCFVEPDQKDCTLCRHRGLSCTFDSAPPVKKRRATQPPRLPKLRGANPQARAAGSPTHADTTGLYQSTVVHDRSMLWAGSSSDHDMYLLRHLPFDRTNRYGHANWHVWRVSPGELVPACFTSYPNMLLDSSVDIYDLSDISRIIGPHHEDLLDLFYAYVHPSLPILEDRSRLQAAITSGSVPASLIAAVYCCAVPFWSLSQSLKGVQSFTIENLREHIFLAITTEARTPSIRTVQALLLYLHVPPTQVREPNHPGFWPLTCQLVALAQDIGLHVEAAAWTISLEEKRIRRILWWAVYMQDKWLAHWLGRPSHILDNQFNVLPLRMEDFGTQPAGDLTASLDAFVRLSRLTVVLSRVLDSFYTINRDAWSMTPEEALRRASECQTALTACMAEQGTVLLRPSRVINDYAFVFAYYGITVSIQRALFACVGGTSYYDLDREKVLFQDLAGVFEDLLQQQLDGLWLSYTKSHVAIIGSFILTALLSSTDEETHRSRQLFLERFQHLLRQLAERFEFAALPLLRLNLLVERFAENGPAEASSTGSV